MHDSISVEVARKIWACLVKYAGATPSELDSFLIATTEHNCDEYRFCGSLGAGGKIYLDNRSARPRWWVNCNREDETLERRAIIRKVNRKLFQLMAGMNPLMQIAVILQKRYAKKYPIRYVELEAETGRKTLCVIWRYANAPHHPYARLSFRDAIEVHHIPKTHLSTNKNWEKAGAVPYEDPGMFDKLDLLVSKVVETRIHLETV